MAEFEEKEVATERDADLPIPDILPVLPLKDVVVFPYIILPLSVSREKSINAVDAALAEQRIIMLVAQKDGAERHAAPRRALHRRHRRRDHADAQAARRAHPPARPGARWTTLTRRQRLVADSGRDSSIRTVFRSGVVGLIVGLELGRQADDPLLQPVAGQALDGHAIKCFAHLVADHAADLRLPLCLHPRCSLLSSRDIPSGRLAELALALHGQDPRHCSPRLRDRAVVLQLPGREREARSPQVLLGFAQGLV